MTSVAKTRVIAIAAVLVAAGGLALIAFGKMGDNLVYYWKPGEMLSKGELAYDATIRLGGVVREGSIHWDEGHTQLDFMVADDKTKDSPAVKVHCTEVPPQMFREGIGVVVEGTFDKSKVFTSNRLMVNHSNEYRPPKPGDDPDKWKESLENTTTASTGAK
ncbi:MAG: cytochrome c maturation protein CcmE [Myxococcaceae bacterium]